MVYIITRHVLSYLTPVVRIKEVVGAALVGRRFLHHRHAGRLRDPHLFLHVIPPFAIITETINIIMIRTLQTNVV